MFHDISNTEKKVENTTQSGIFLTNFELFDIVMKHRDECLIQLLKQTDFEGEIEDAKTRSFSSDIQTRHGARFPLSLAFEFCRFPYHSSKSFDLEWKLKTQSLPIKLIKLLLSLHLLLISNHLTAVYLKI